MITESEMLEILETQELILSQLRDIRKRILLMLANFEDEDN